MISAFQKTISSALLSFSSAKEPKLLKRPSSDISSPPNDPAGSPPEASMPQFKSSTFSKRGKAAEEFLIKNFNGAGEEHDPIEESSPRQTARRIKSTSHNSAGKGQESPVSTRPRTPVSKPEITHSHLLVDPDERFLFYGNAPEDPNAVPISIPGSTRPKGDHRLNMRGPRFRPIDTLNKPKQSHVSGSSKTNLQAPHSRMSKSYSSRTSIPLSNTNYSSRNGSGEPPLKRQRHNDISTQYVKSESAGAVSPIFFSSIDPEISSQKSTAPASRRSPTGNVSDHLQIAVNEFQEVEKIVRPSQASMEALESLRRRSVTELTAGRQQQSDESDSETFTRQAKRLRYEENGPTELRSRSEAQGIEVAGDDSEGSRHIPEVIQSLFPTSYSPNDAQFSNEPNSVILDVPPTATSSSIRPKQSSRVAPIPSSAGSETATKHPLVHNDMPGAKGRKQKVSGAKDADKQSPKFPLRWFFYDFLPPKSTYSIVIREAKLEIWDSESSLSDEPIWAPLLLTKVFKIYHGTDECFMVRLDSSKSQGQLNQPIYLDFESGEDRDKFLELLNTIVVKVLVLAKDQEWMRKALYRQLEETQQRLEDNNRQPIRKQQKISHLTSPHFPNQQDVSTRYVPKDEKLVSRLQASTSDVKTSAADNQTRTVITGRERANQSSSASSEIFRPSSKKSISDQARGSKSSEVPWASDSIPVTRSSLKAERSTDQIEEETMSRKKFSLEHGLGDPWKKPLIYPKIGKRRETVQFDDLFRLDEDEFLNDNLIGFFLRYLEHHLEQNHPTLARRVYFYNSYFFERLMQTSKGKKGINYESVQKWTRNVDIFNHDFIVVPVNESFHWYVAIICNLSKLHLADDNEGDVVMSETLSSKDQAIVREEGETRTDLIAEEIRNPPTEKTRESLSHLSLSDNDKQMDELALSANPISSLSSPRPGSTPKKTVSGQRKSARYSLPKHDISAPMIITLDSLGAPRSSTCTALRQYIVEEAKGKKGWDIDGRLIKGMTARGIPTQPNFSDCGLYLCAYMEKFILDPANFIGKILQREMNAEKDMPLPPSEELRSRMRGMIQELHNKQEDKETEVPLPEVGRILLSPVRPDSPLNHSGPRTPLREDSEDELQQDQAKFQVYDAEGSPPSKAVAQEYKHDQTSPTSTMSSDNTKHKLSQTATIVQDLITKINGSAGSPSGTREAAITIEDDEDIQPAPKNVHTKKNSPAKDDFFEHPSELKASTPVNKGSAAVRKIKKASVGQQTQRRRRRSKAPADSAQKAKDASSTGQQTQRRRSRSRAASASSLDTNYLESGKSYDTADHEEDVAKRHGSKSQSRIVVMIPDSQKIEKLDLRAEAEGAGTEAVIERKGKSHRSKSEDEEQQLKRY